MLAHRRTWQCNRYELVLCPLSALYCSISHSGWNILIRANNRRQKAHCTLVAYGNDGSNVAFIRSRCHWDDDENKK